MEIPKQIKELAKLPDTIENDLLETVIERKELRKGEFLFRSGDVCNQVYFIEEGLLRIFYYSDSGKDITNWFCSEGAFTTAIDSFFYHQPTHDYCEALTDCVLYSIKLSELEEILKNEQGAKLAFQTLYQTTRQVIDYIVSLKFQSAENRYKNLLKNNPGIIQRAPLGHIASYLGITQETLSRIRAGK